MRNSNLSAAIGYYELSMYDDCQRILADLEIFEACSERALELKGAVAVARHDWSEALAIANEAVLRYSHALSGYFLKAYAFHELDQTQAALETLDVLRGNVDVTREPLYHYNRACYSTVLGSLRIGRLSLLKAVVLDPDLASTAAQDPDLEALKASALWPF